MKKLMMAAFLLLGMATMVKAAEETNRVAVSVYFSTTAVPSSLAVSGPGMVYGLILTSGTATNYCVMRDTGTLNTTSAQLLPRVSFTSSPQVIQLNTPVRFNNGLEANNGVSLAPGQEDCGILYRKGKLW